MLIPNDELLRKTRAATRTHFNNLPTPSLSSAFLPYLDQDVFVQYRLDYQMFRHGVGYGAVGEVSMIDASKGRQIFRYPVALPGRIISVGDDTDEDMEGKRGGEGGNFGTDDSFADEIATFIRDVDVFRAGYRRFRRGEARGAEKEISNLSRNLTSAHIRLLPAIQCSELYSASAQDAEKKESTYQQSCSISPTTTTGSSTPDTFPSRTVIPHYAPTNLHLHFGAGKIGLGLLLPAMESSGRPYALVNHRVKTWAPIISSPSDVVTVKINNTNSVPLKIIREGEVEKVSSILSSVTEKENVTMMDEDGQNPTGMLICTEDENELKELTKNATSFSLSVGPGMDDVTELLLRILPTPEKGTHKPTLYGCENDHKALTRLSERLAEKVDVLHCMIDRICISRDIEENEIRVATEPDTGEIVVMPIAKKFLYRPAFGDDSVYLPKLHAQAAYLANRKISLVNGMHTTLAFMTLNISQDRNCEKPESFELLTSTTLPESKKPDVFAWAVARCLMILHQHDVDVIKSAHGLTNNAAVCRMLLDYAQKTLRRFTSVKDTTGRVLSGGVANRWQTRLQPVDKFLMTYDVDEIPLGRQLVKFSGLTEGNLVRAVRKLTEDTYKFTGLGVVREAKVTM